VVIGVAPVGVADVVHTVVAAAVAGIGQAGADGVVRSGNVNGPLAGKVGATRARTATLVASSVNPPGAVVWAAACPAIAKATAPATTRVADRRHAVARIPSEVAEDGAHEADRAWACIISGASPVVNVRIRHHSPPAPRVAPCLSEGNPSRAKEIIATRGQA
jgi:hypothetical protein